MVKPSGGRRFGAGASYGSRSLSKEAFHEAKAKAQAQEQLKDFLEATPRTRVRTGASFAAISRAAQIKQEKVIDSVFNRAIAMDPKIEFAMLARDLEFIDAQDFCLWVEKRDAKVGQAIMASIGQVVKKRLRNRIMHKELAPLSAATNEILKARSKVGNFPGTRRRVNRPLHRPHSKGKNMNLLDSIQLIGATEKSGSAIGGTLFVGIPGDVEHPESGINMARLARMMEKGYTIKMSPGKARFLARLAAKNGLRRSRKDQTPKRAFLTVPPRPILEAADDILGSETPSKIAEDTFKLELSKSGTKIGKKVRKGGASAFNDKGHIHPEVERKAKSRTSKERKIGLSGVIATAASKVRSFFRGMFG